MDSTPNSSSNCFLRYPLLPFGSQLCLFCAHPMHTISYKYRFGFKNGTDLISQSTFLQAMGLFCDLLKVDQEFKRIEKWTLLGVNNVANFVCCEKCGILLQQLVELHQIILEKQNALKSKLEDLANQIIESSPTKEYSFNACFHFREEIIKKHKVNNETINKAANATPESTPPIPKLTPDPLHPKYCPPKGATVARLVALVRRKYSSQLPLKHSSTTKPNNIKNTEIHHHHRPTMSNSNAPDDQVNKNNLGFDCYRHPTTTPFELPKPRKFCYCLPCLAYFDNDLSNRKQGQRTFT